MPKRPPRNKKFRPRLETPRAYGQRGPFNVKDLLAKAGITSKGIAQFADQQSRWSAKLAAALDPALFEKITGTGFDAGTLTVYVESAAWSARLRYALAECLPLLQEAEATLTTVSVRLRPRAAPTDTPGPAHGR
jgi:Dna[CI] antecedent, DciA